MFAYDRWIRKYPTALAMTLVFLPSLVDVQPASAQPPGSDIVVRASQQTKHYSEEFRNLLAKERKTIRIFDTNGNPKRQRVIISHFLVYELAKRKGDITELRSVISVDGKPVSDVEKRATELFERVSRTDSPERELERIQKESLRYDDELQIVGLTLFQGIALDPRVRDSFQFEVSGETAQAYVLDYKQINDSDLIRISDRSGRPAVLEYDFDLGDLKNARPRLKGQLWIDKRNFRIQREVRELVIHPGGLGTPIVIAANEFEYSPSEFGIHAPKRIVHTEFRLGRKDRRPAKEIEYEFVYSDFIRPKVEVTSNKGASP